MFQSKPYKGIKKDVESILGKKSGTIALSNAVIARKNGGTYEIFFDMRKYLLDRDLEKSCEETTPIALTKKDLVRIPESRILDIQTPDEALRAAKQILHPSKKEFKLYDKPIKI